VVSCGQLWSAVVRVVVSSAVVSLVRVVVSSGQFGQFWSLWSVSLQMGNICATSYRTEEASVAIASSVIDSVVGQVVDETYHGNGAHLHICDIVVWCTDTPDGYATYTIRHGKKIASFQALNSATRAIIAEVRACFVDTAFTTFYVTSDNGFNVGHFELCQNIHPTDVFALEILSDILREMPNARE
jgi:hypothetical protein